MQLHVQSNYNKGFIHFYYLTLKLQIDFKISISKFAEYYG